MILLLAFWATRGARSRTEKPFIFLYRAKKALFPISEADLDEAVENVSSHAIRHEVKAPLWHVLIFHTEPLPAIQLQSNLDKHDFNAVYYTNYLSPGGRMNCFRSQILILLGYR